MPKLIIPIGQGRMQVFPFEGSEVVLGRGDDADLVLPNVSVSRRHARITIEGDSVFIEDLDSRNGVRVNGDVIERKELAPEDEIRVGKYTVVLLTERTRFYKGRCIEYMPLYTTENLASHAVTHSLSPDELARLEVEVHRIRNASVVNANNPAQFWHPEDRKLTFGADAMIAVAGFFTGGTVAEVAWDGQFHLVRKTGRMVKVLVNGDAVIEQRLGHGDKLQIGSTLFRYMVPS